jgi:hypothetical protein
MPPHWTRVSTALACLPPGGWCGADFPPIDRLSGWNTARCEAIIAELQARFDHLAGAPKAS